MAIFAYIASSLSSFLHLWARLVMAFLWIIWSPVTLLYSALLYTLTHGWTLALGIAALSCLALHYQRRRHSSKYDQSLQLPLLVNRVLKALPVLPKKGWNIERVSQGVRVHSKFFPSLVTPAGTSLVAATTLLDSEIQHAMKYILSPTDMQLWFGQVQGTIRSSTTSHSVPDGSDIINLTIKKDDRFAGELKRGFLNAIKYCSKFIEKWLPLLGTFIPLYSDVSQEKIERTWHTNGDISYIFSSLVQTTPTSLPFRWSLFIVSTVSQHKKDQHPWSLLTVILCPTSSNDLIPTTECIATQISSLRQHILMSQLKAYNINYSLKETTPTTPPTPLLDTPTTGPDMASETHVVEETKPLEPSSPARVDSKSDEDQSSVSNGRVPTGPYAEYDQRYLSMAIKCAEDLISVSKATVEDGWISLGTSKGIAILKKIPEKGEPPVNSVKGTGKINCPPDFLIRILMDPAYSKQLDDMLDKMTLVQSVQDHVQLMYLKYKAVWPTSARDFCALNVFGQYNKNTYLHAATSVVDPRVPEERGYVRGDVLSGGYIIEVCPGKPEFSRVTYVTQVDLKGNVPAFLVNKICESQPQCVNHFRHIAEAEYAKLKRNLIKMKQFEKQFPIPQIIKNRPTSSLSSPPPPPRPLEENLPSLTEPSPSEQEEGEPSMPLPPPALSVVSETKANNNDEFPLSGQSIGTHNAPQTSSEFVSEDEERREGGGEERREGGGEELTLSHTDTFNAHGVPSLPIATLLDKIPRYRSDSTESDDTTVNTSITASTITSALIDYPRTEEGIDFRTMGNQNAARLLEEMFHISELDLMNPVTYRDQSNGWKFQGIEKDVVIFKKKKVSESPFHSFIGKGLIDLSPQEVYNCVRNPNQRYIFDNMLKELHVVKQIESDLYILHMQHETTQCFLKQSRDFCILVCERSEPNKKIIVGASVEIPECPPQPNCTRGKVMTSGWVIEPYRYKEKLLTQVTYLVQVDMGGVPATLVNFVSRRQPLAVAYLRDYLETTSLNSNRNGRESRPSLLSGTDSPSDLTMMYKTYV